MREDSGYSLLCSLEIYDDDRNFKAKSDMFTKRTIRPNLVIDHVETASEALMLSVQERTSVDLSYMEQLTGKPRDELLQELTGVVFRVPGETTAAGEPLYQTGEEYLSGDVRKKLATAEIFAQQDPSYQVNVDSLRGVQPKDLTASEIELHLGTTWIPPEDIKQFILETMEPNRWAAQSIKVSYNRLNATWNIEGSSVDSYSLKATTTFGTKRKNFYEILRCSLNLQAVKVVDYIEDVDGKKKAVPNVKETRLAQDKQQQIETAFKDWIYRDPVRRRRLVDYYNTHYNNLRPREYDGSFLRFPGMSPEISLRPHQRNVVARILFGGNTLVAHSVGAGKTMVMGAAAMEKKRLGLCNKTLIIVPNHLTEQMGSELLSLYPNANILVATKRDFEKDRRKLFCSRIATGNYDIVIMGHSQFSRIPLSTERQQKFLQDEIERYTQEIASAKKEKSGQDLSVKQMEATKKRLQSHLEELMDSPKDDVVTFEQLGVDSLMVDESEYLDNAPLQWTDAQHGDLMHRVEDAAHLANISIVKDIRHGSGFFDAPRNTIHIREGENDTEQLKSLLEGYSEAVITRTSTSDKPVAELESAALAALLQVRCGVPVDGQLSERITTALEDARQVSGFSMKDSVARLHNAMEYCVRYAELEQTSEQYHAQQIEPEAMTPQSEAFMEMM